MSINSHITNLYDILLCRIDNLSYYTDYYFIDKRVLIAGTIFNMKTDVKRVPTKNSVDLCDLIHTMITNTCKYELKDYPYSRLHTNTDFYTTLVALLFMIPEHRNEREVKLIDDLLLK